MGVMGRPGRKSLDQLVMAPIVETINRVDGRRPSPPESLTIPQAEIWQSIVDALPATWFAPENQPLLEQYCRHITSARNIALRIEQALFDPEASLYKLKILHDMQVKETQQIHTLSQKMRLNQACVIPGASARKIIDGVLAREEGNPWD